jgi:glycerol uptake facilitator protein
MSPLAAEFLGTLFLVLLGDGVVANVLLNDTKGKGSGWIVITTGWAIAVFVGVLIAGSYSGAHLNPAVTLGLAVVGAFPWTSVIPYMIAQMLGGIVGAFLVYLAYLPHWKGTPDGATTRAVFCTAPALRNNVSNLICEIIGTFVLVFAILEIKGAFERPLSGAAIPIELGALGAVPVMLIVWGIGLSLGGPTGYAINPARDLGPRIAYALLPMGRRSSADWGYAWIPVLGPLLGATVAAFLFHSLSKG